MDSKIRRELLDSVKEACEDACSVKRRRAEQDEGPRSVHLNTLTIELNGMKDEIVKFIESHAIKIGVCEVPVPRPYVSADAEAAARLADALATKRHKLERLRSEQRERLLRIVNERLAQLADAHGETHVACSVDPSNKLPTKSEDAQELPSFKELEALFQRSARAAEQAIAEAEAARGALKRVLGAVDKEANSAPSYTEMVVKCGDSIPKTNSPLK